MLLMLFLVIFLQTFCWQLRVMWRSEACSGGCAFVVVVVVVVEQILWVA